ANRATDGPTVEFAPDASDEKQVVVRAERHHQHGRADGHVVADVGMTEPGEQLCASAMARSFSSCAISTKESAALASRSISAIARAPSARRLPLYVRGRNALGDHHPPRVEHELTQLVVIERGQPRKHPVVAHVRGNRMHELVW